VTVTLPERLLNTSTAALLELACRANPGVWAQVKRGYTNAPFHDEWYSLLPRARRLCLVAPREHAKSETVTVNGSSWRSIYWPGFWTYAFAATAAQGEELKARIDAAVLEAAPDLVVNARVMSKTQSIYANGSRITVAGVGKSVRGAHPDMSLTEHQRKKLERWWFGTVGGMAHPGTSRVVRGYGRLHFPPTQVFLVGTPFHAQDLLMNMRTNPLWEFRRYAAEFDPHQMVPGSYAVEITNRAS
jgi:hypothetical protein